MAAGEVPRLHVGRAHVPLLRRAALHAQQEVVLLDVLVPWTRKMANARNGLSIAAGGNELTESTLFREF